MGSYGRRYQRYVVVESLYESWVYGLVNPKAICYPELSSVITVVRDRFQCCRLLSCLVDGVGARLNETSSTMLKLRGSPFASRPTPGRPIANGRSGERSGLPSDLPADIRSRECLPRTGEPGALSSAGEVNPPRSPAPKLGWKIELQLTFRQWSVCVRSYIPY